MKPAIKRPGRKETARQSAGRQPVGRKKAARGKAAPVPPTAPVAPLAGIRIPAILLEGDDLPLPPEPTLIPAPMEKFSAPAPEIDEAEVAVAPVAPETTVLPALEPAERPELAESAKVEVLPPVAEVPAPAPEPAATPALAPPADSGLPQSYGTCRLVLAARDARWLYAHWDMDRERLRAHNAAAAGGHLVLRVHKHSVATPAYSRIDLHSDSTHWFVPVDEAATRYIAEIGYDSAAGEWIPIAVSEATLTPPESVSDDTSTRFATIPQDIPLPQLLGLVKTAVAEQPSLAAALEELRQDGHPALPPAPAARAEIWTPAQERALARVISLDESRRVWMGSLEVTEVIRRQLKEEVSSAGLGGAGQPGVPGVSSLGVAMPSSPAAVAAPAKARKFWLNVNAELVIYGATEPDARVTIGARKIKLRPDGTFSFRFVLPDGEYELPVAAESGDGEETREARLRFRRDTERRGAVAAHPQDPRLGKPEVANVA
jgi:hypothetical protein